MSLEAQEQALLALLFDEGMRARFARYGPEALKSLDLTEEELADFAEVRVDALEMDAQMRRSMVLSQLALSFPLSFSIISSIGDGLDLLRALVDPQTMRTPPVERAFVFGKRLRRQLGDDAAGPSAEQAGFRSVLDAELGMAWTAASLRREVLDLGRAPTPAPPDTDWTARALRVAPFVSATVIPAPREALRRALSPVPDRELWRHLGEAPIAAEQVTAALSGQAPRLLVTRAEIDRASRCDPTARHVTVELSDGFASLIGYADGNNSLDALLAGLGKSGATDLILDGVRSGFEELMVQGMLESA